MEELNSLGLLITSLRDGIVPQAKRINAGNTPVHMHTATGSQPLTDPHMLKSIELITNWAALAINCLQGQLPIPRHFANFLPQFGLRLAAQHLMRHRRWYSCFNIYNLCPNLAILFQHNNIFLQIHTGMFHY